MRWTRRRPPRFAHIVDRGGVGCPRAETDVGVERCVVCPFYTRTVEHDEAVYVVCRPHGLDEMVLQSKAMTV